MELVALLPWWAGVALAIGLYLWLHAVATAPLPPVTPGKFGDPTSAMWKPKIAAIHTGSRLAAAAPLRTWSSVSSAL